MVSEPENSDQRDDSAPGDPSATDAALAASIFHFGISSARSLKQELAKAGVPVRLPC